MKHEKEHKTFLGMPMNWEWDTQKVFKTWWNPDDDRLLPPKAFGIGWTINFHAALRKAKVIQGNKESK